VWTEEKPPLEDFVNELKHYGVAGMQRGIRKLDMLDAQANRRADAIKVARVALLKKRPVASVKRKKLTPAQQARMKRIKLKLAKLRANGLKNGKPYNYSKQEVNNITNATMSKRGINIAKYTMNTNAKTKGYSTASY
jgi:hypothetical protein